MDYSREQGWRSGESTRLPPMWLRFDSRTRCHMWVEFVVGSRPCSEGFSPGTPVFLPPQKPTFPNFQFVLETVERRATLWIPLKFLFITQSYSWYSVNENGEKIKEKSKQKRKETNLYNPVPPMC